MGNGKIGSISVECESFKKLIIIVNIINIVDIINFQTPLVLILFKINKIMLCYTFLKINFLGDSVFLGPVLPIQFTSI